MPIAPVIPDCKIVFPPLEADLRVMVLGDQIYQIVEEQVALIFGNTIDSFCESLVDENRLPSCHSCLELVFEEHRA